MPLDASGAGSAEDVSAAALSAFEVEGVFGETLPESERI
jgi:hypothetical protein